MRNQDTSIGLRLPASVVVRLDALIDRLRPKAVLGERLSRSAVVRTAVLIGLQELERKHLGPVEK